LAVPRLLRTLVSQAPRQDRTTSFKVRLAGGCCLLEGWQLLTGLDDAADRR
jgi:hypothetical protein